MNKHTENRHIVEEMYYNNEEIYYSIEEICYSNADKYNNYRFFLITVLEILIYALEKLYLKAQKFINYSYCFKIIHVLIC